MLIRAMISLRSRLFLCLLLWFVAGLVLAPAVHGQGNPNRAGLLIQHGDGTISTTCVSFEEPSITGLELLRRAGLSVSADSSSGLGTIICGLDGEGCNYPEENCFCQCQGANCVYWQYWYLAEGEWQYSQIGALGRQVTDGSVNGWVWGEGDPGGGQQPPATSFSEICAAEAPAAGTTEEPSPETQAAATPSSSEPAAAVDGQASQPMPTATPTATPAGTSGQLCTASYIPLFAVFVAVAGIIAGRNRRI